VPVSFGRHAGCSASLAPGRPLPGGFGAKPAAFLVLAHPYPPRSGTPRSRPSFLIPDSGIRDKRCYPEYERSRREKFGLFDP
jgi:hypothetical protein